VWARVCGFTAEAQGAQSKGKSFCLIDSKNVGFLRGSLRFTSRSLAKAGD